MQRLEERVRDKIKNFEAEIYGLYGLMEMSTYMCIWKNDSTSMFFTRPLDKPTGYHEQASA